MSDAKNLPERPIKGAHLETILLAQCDGWRAGAQEIRDDCKRQFNVVLADAEMGATLLEACAKRIETIIRAVRENQNK